MDADAPGSNGWPAVKIFDGAATGYSYDDLIFMPGHVSFEAESVDCRCQITRNIWLHTPVIGSPIDTVTESDAAIALALEGGIGFIHGWQGIQEQVDMVTRVRRHASTFIFQPVTLSPDHTLANLDELHAHTGISCVLITENGNAEEELKGIVSSRDADHIEDRETLLAEVMVTDLVVGHDPITIDEAWELLKKKKVGKLPIVNQEHKLVSMVTRSDIKKLERYPCMSRDQNGNLLVGAAISLGQGAADWERATKLAEAGAHILYVDIGACSGGEMYDFIRALKVHYPKAQVMAGPVSSCRAAKRLMDAGADAIQVGTCMQVPGRLETVGRSDATAVFEIAPYARLNYGLPAVAAGKLENVGHMLKALCLGASAVMPSQLFAGSFEAPGVTL